MIVVFRRIKEAAGRVTGTEWVLVAVEGFLVFLGIYAAFQLQEWAEDRREAEQVERLMERLLTETRQALVHYDYHARDTQKRLTRAKANLADFSTGRCPTDFANIEEVDLLPGDPPPDTALTELVDVVGLSALPDDELKSRLAGYHYATNVFYGEGLPALQQGRESLLANDDPNAPNAPDGEALRTDHGFVSQMLTPPTILSRRYDRAALCADADFKSRYAAATQRLLEVAALRNDLLLLTLSTCQSISQSLGQECVDETVRQAMGADRTSAVERQLEAFNSRRATSDPNAD